MEFTRDTGKIIGEFYRDEHGSIYERLADGTVAFGDVARGLCGQQSQYASFYVEGKVKGYPALGSGLRFSGDPMDYHDLGIHPDDVEEFVVRMNAYSAVMSLEVPDREAGRRRATQLEIELGRRYLKLSLGIEV